MGLVKLRAGDLQEAVLVGLILGRAPDSQGDILRLGGSFGSGRSLGFGGLLSSGSGGGVSLGSAGSQRQHHAHCEKQCKDLFHFTFPPYNLGLRGFSSGGLSASRKNPENLRISRDFFH